MSEPTCQALCYSGESCFSNVGTNLPGTVLQWCRLFKHCRNLPAGHCVTGVQAVKALSEPTYHALCCRGEAVLAMSEPTRRALCYSGADCLSGVGTFLLGTVLQWGRLFKGCQNLPAVHCVTEVKAVLAMSESTCQALCYSGEDCVKKCQNLPTGHLCCRGADCLSSVRTYLPALCYSGAGWLSGVGTYLPGTVLQWCRLFKRCQNLPTGYCVTVVQTV